MFGIPADRNFKGQGVDVGPSCQPASRDSHIRNREAAVHMLVYIRDPISAVVIVVSRAYVLSVFAVAGEHCSV